MASVVSSDDEVIKVLTHLAGKRCCGQRVDPPAFHPFPARMPLSLAGYLIESLTTTQATILDPMMGSGTTLVAAAKIDRAAVGFDRDPLALLIARSATNTYNSIGLENLRIRILERAKSLISSDAYRLPTIRRQRMPEEEQQFIRFWFPWRSQKQLFALSDAIRTEPEGPGKDFAWLLFSSLIVAKSSGASLALDISRSRPHRRTDKPVTLPFTGWNKRFKFALTRLPFINKQKSIKTQVLAGDARCLPIEKKVADLVLTSPPYLNAVDYIRVHKFSLVWMGYNLGALRELRGTMIGSERGLWSLDGIPPKLETLLDYKISDGRRRAIVRKYLSDTRRVLGEIQRVLRPGGLSVFVLGPNIINKKRTDAVEVIASISSSVGLKTVGYVTRNLCSARRSLPPPSAVNGNPLAKRMRKELIIAFRK